MSALKLGAIAAFAIFRFAYNQVGDNLVAASICGSSFFIDKKTALTSNHIFRNQKHEFRNYKYWLISRDGKIIPIREEFLTHHPEIDLTVINFPDSQVNEAFEFAEDPPEKGATVYSQGHIHEKRPNFKFAWSPSGVNILEVDLSDFVIDKEGVIESIEKIALSHRGTYLGTANMIGISFHGVRGMSGGPVVRKSDYKVIGLVSAFDQQDKDITFAISAEEIRRKLF